MLGLDPGTATTGFGIIKKTGSDLKIIDYGCIKTPAGLSLPERLNQIADDLSSLIKDFKPNICSIEDLFFAKNTKTALAVAQARGVMLYTLYRHGLDIYSYTPLQIKLSITNYGRASKQQVQTMTKQLLNLKHIPRPDDSADALAAAICHAKHSDLIMAKKSSKLRH